jgi:hypothetical protein
MTPPSPGPKVDDTEDLYRGITTPDWWVADEGRPSSAAFKHPDFSVDIASLAGSPAHTLGHLPPGSGVVAFNCGIAHGIGFEVRQEPDPDHPDNHAHANVYNPASPNQRKKMAQRLAAQCRLVHPPAFASPENPTAEDP